MPTRWLRLCLAGLLATGFAQAQGEQRRWAFRVLLDGTPVGTHIFTLQDKGPFRELRSEASFAVKILRVTVYRYQHQATELWQGDCLVSMQARTNDDGRLLSVEARRENSTMTVETKDLRESFSGCVISFAYWNPLILTADRLLNAQTGRLDRVAIEAQGRDMVANGRGKSVAANRYRIVGQEQPITLWYDEAGNWVGLESRVGMNRKLSYQLE